MDTLEKVSRNNVITLLNKYIDIFSEFDQVYLFGSILRQKNIPNDVIYESMNPSIVSGFFVLRGLNEISY